jgi:histone deacetylase 11
MKDSIVSRVLRDQDRLGSFRANDQPDLVIYNAGSDPFAGDPLAGFRLTESDIAERDLLVISLVRDRGIPVAMVLSGGYSAESWRIHADSIEGILTRFDRDDRSSGDW